MEQPRVVYSTNVRVGGDGLGYTAWQALAQLRHVGVLELVLASSFAPQADLPPDVGRAWGTAGRVLKRLAVFDPAHRLEYWTDVLFDRWAARFAGRGNLFHGWTHHCLRTLGVCDRLGRPTVLERPNSHPRTFWALMQEEHERWGVPMPSWRKILRRAESEIARAGRLIVPSTFAFDSFVAHGVPRERVTVVPYGVDGQRFQPRESPPGGPFRVLFVGQGDLRKGLLYLLEAWRQLAWQDAELWVVGRIDPILEKVAGDHLRQPGLRLLGFQRDPPPYYHQVHAFVLPSIEDGYGLVALEAMASGVPLIVTENVGCQDVVTEECGFVVPIRDAEALADRIEVLRSRPSRRVAMGRAGRRAAEQLGWWRYGDRLIELYRETLAV